MVTTIVTVDRAPFFADIYHYLLKAPWLYLMLIIALTFAGMNAIFAIAYMADKGIENARPDSFADAFFFSVQTMATIGYGKMSPDSIVANVLVSFEALLGLVGLAMVTGLVFAKFSHPSARVRFSAVAVVHPRDGVPCLMFRMANVRANRIVEANVHVVFACQETTREGETLRRFYDLALERDRSALFTLSWTVIHRIVEGSPLYGATPESLEKVDAEIVVSVVGLDETFAQTVHARTSYLPDQIIWGARFADILTRGERGIARIDYTRFDEVMTTES